MAPGDVARDGAVAGHLDCNFRGRARAGDVYYSDFAGFMKRRGDRAHRGFDAMIAVSDFPQVRQRGDQSDGAVHTHAEISNVVEENYASGAGRIGGLAENSADNHFGAARFIGERAAEIIGIEAKALELLSYRAAAEVRSAADNNSGGLATGVGIDDMDEFDRVKHVRGAIFNTWFGKTHEQAIRSSLGDACVKMQYCVSGQTFASEIATCFDAAARGRGRKANEEKAKASEKRNGGGASAVEPECRQLGIDGQACI